MQAHLSASSFAGWPVQSTPDDRPCTPQASSDAPADAVNPEHPLSIFERLPCELYERVFDLLDDPADVCSVAATCTRLQAAVWPQLKAMRQLAALVGSRDVPAALDEVLASASGMSRFAARLLLPTAALALMRLPAGGAGFDTWGQHFAAMVDGLGRQPQLQHLLRQCQAAAQAYVQARDAPHPDSQALASASSKVLTLAKSLPLPARQLVLQTLVDDLYARTYSTQISLTGPTRPLLDMFTTLLKRAAKAPPAHRMALLTPLLLGARTLDDRHAPDAVYAVMKVTDEMPEPDRLEALMCLRAGLEAMRWRTPQSVSDLDLATAFYPPVARQRAQARIDARIHRLDLKR